LKCTPQLCLKFLLWPRQMYHAVMLTNLILCIYLHMHVARIVLSV
jgi:hypothetical protein